MYETGGRIKYGLKEFSPEVVTRFDKFIISSSSDNTTRTIGRYLYVLSQIPDNILDVKSKQDILTLQGYLLDHDQKAKQNIKRNKNGTRKQRGVFQFHKNYLITYYALKKWLIFKSYPELCQYLKQPAKKKARDDVTEINIKITNDDVQVILDALDTYYKPIITGATVKDRPKREYEYDRDKFLIKLLHATGSRISETLQLRTEFFDKTGKLTFCIPKKFTKSRKDKTKYFTKALDKDRAVFFEKHCKHNNKIFRYDMPDMPDENIAEDFKGTYQLMYSINCVEYLFKQLEHIIGFEKNTISPHKFRHLLGKTLREKNVPLDIIQRVLTHDSPVSTQIYSHLSDEKVRSAYKAIKG